VSEEYESRIRTELGEMEAEELTEKVIHYREQWHIAVKQADLHRRRWESVKEFADNLEPFNKDLHELLKSRLEKIEEQIK